MNTEQKIITIAEFEGWKELRDGRWKLAETGIVERFLPPYLTSRDAICGAVARLDELHFRSFVVNLEATTECRHWWNDMQEDDMRRILLATPAQLADALLLTLGHEI